MGRVSSCTLSALLILLAASSGTVEGAKRRQQRQRRQVEVGSGPTPEQIWDTGLMEKKLSYITVLERGREYYDDPTARRFKGFVLGYVTPWNRAGYSHAVTFRRKLDAVAPVWFQIKMEEGQQAPTITGTHEINQTWISELREGGGGPLVVPRFIIEAQPAQHVAMLRDPRPLLEAVGKVVFENNFDGMVLETWVAWQSFNGLANEAFKQLALGLVARLAELMHTNGNRKFFLAVPPLVPATPKSPWLAREDMLELSPHVDGLSVMAYDHSTASGRPGGNAPMTWLAANLVLMDQGAEGSNDPPLPESLRPRILLGANFYGWDFAPARGGLAAVTAADLVPLLQRQQPELAWHEGVEEHSFEYKDKEGTVHHVWYPTPRSLESRLQAARDAGVGISIWELGQGLERFFDLL